jgi:hypothetical protein
MTPLLRTSSPDAEGTLQVSKQLKFQVLLDISEMKTLFENLGAFYLCAVAEPTSLDKALIPQQEFLEQYAAYIDGLKRGKLVDEKPLRRFFSSAWTTDLGAVYAMLLPSDKCLVKPIKPLIQLQGHHFFYSHLDHLFHPMVFSRESVSWGIQFSYPQLCQHPRTSDILKVGMGEDFPNTPLFQKLSKWLRDHTLPTPFVMDGKRVNAPIRIGKQCLSWIGKHPQLIQKGIEIFSFSASNNSL